MKLKSQQNQEFQKIANIDIKFKKKSNKNKLKIVIFTNKNNFGNKRFQRVAYTEYSV